MTKAAESWKEIGSKLEALGLKLKYHFEQERSEDQPEVDPTTMQRLGRAIDDVGDSIEHAFKDEGVRTDVKDVFATLPSALAETFSQIADDVKKAIDKRSAGAAESAPPEPPTE